MTPSPVVEFYAGRAPDYRGRRLADVWGRDHGRLEADHSYIQVLFPNRRPSGVTPLAPTLDDAAVATFRADAVLRANLARSHDLMLDFYGLAFDPASGRVARAAHFADRAAVWLHAGDHNHLRITRILLCLNELGLPARAAAFFEALAAVRREFPTRASAATFFWERAARGEG